MPLGGMKSHQAHRSLRVLESRGTASIRAHLGARHPVLEQHTGDPPRRQPVADLGAFEVDGQDVIASARKTTTATPVFFPFGEYTVIVGVETLLT